jgi:uncharacterized membrane protein
VAEIVPRSREDSDRAVIDGLSAVLATGTALAAGAMALGLLFVLWTGRAGASVDGSTLLENLSQPARPRPGVPITPAQIAAGLARLEPIAVLALGVTVLFATPVARVATLVVLYWVARRRLLATIAAGVLLMLLVSVCGGLPTSR